MTAFLGSDVLLNSTVLSMNRSGNGPVQVLVQTPAGRKLIIAKKLVSTPPPRLASLGGYDLSEDETALFSQLSANGYYTGILNNTGFTVNMDAAAPGQPYDIPTLPRPYSFKYQSGANPSLLRQSGGAPRGGRQSRHLGNGETNPGGEGYIDGKYSRLARVLQPRALQPNGVERRDPRRVFKEAVRASGETAYILQRRGVAYAGFERAVAVYGGLRASYYFGFVIVGMYHGRKREWTS